jgi:NAD(P)-dependent dehydrogenase (short-subunit alcohol dehydrogenase family)
MRDRAALVTGAGRGIGRAAALALAQGGARVMAVARTQSQLAEVAAAAPAVSYLAESVATAEGCARIVEETRKLLGKIDILVNNAGIVSAHERPIWEQDPALWRTTMAVNLDAPFELTRLTARGMMERRWGRIVMVSSTTGELGGPSESAYDASKHGLLGLMRAVAQDVAPYGVTCNAVLPGWVRTHMSETSARAEAEKRGISVDQVWEERARAYPAGRIPTAEEVAEVIAFLASEQASGVNGEAVKVSVGSLW